MDRWLPSDDVTPKEEVLMKRLTRVRPLFGFLRLRRRELFDDEFQEQLEGMYRATGAGEPPLAPAMMCMVVLLQGYVGASDAEAVELAVVDLRWQMVLGCIGADAPAFSQGALQDFRERMVTHNMDRVLLERSVQLVRSGSMTKREGAGLSEALRAALDSRPLVGAGRVEDTINLLGHAARSIVQMVKKLTGRSAEDICKSARIPLLLAPSIKAGLDIDWSDPKQKASAIEVVERQVSSLQQWVEKHLDDVISRPLQPYIDAITQVRAQDVEVSEGGGVRIREGVAPDRRVSVEDAEMRHGRKSRSKRFNGYKEHIARDLDSAAIVACAVTPANHPEEEAAVPIAADISRQGLQLVELHIDRAYVNSPVVGDVFAAGGQVLSKPWGVQARRPDLFTKRDFKIDPHAQTVTCPAGECEPFEPGETVEFDPEACGACPLRANCTQAASGRGRTISMLEDEATQARFRKLQQTPSGRRLLRERTAVEHSLARIAARKGSRARYVGVRKNEFDLRRAATIQNLEAIHRELREAA
jgi:hypothetical protein